MNKENLQSLAMEILLHAGDGRTKVLEALDKVASYDYDLAEELINSANEDITAAHVIHTKALQDVALDSYSEEYSMLFTHAQDTLMTIRTEYLIAQKIIKISTSFDERIKKTEDVKNV